MQLSNLTASMRFEGALNVDLNEITTTLVPLPKLHFLQASISPLFAPLDAGDSSNSRKIDASFSEAFLKGRQLARGDPKQAVHLACGLLTRGDLLLTDLTRNAARLRREIKMVHWNPEGGERPGTGKGRGRGGNDAAAYCLVFF